MLVDGIPSHSSNPKFVCAPCRTRFHSPDDLLHPLMIGALSSAIMCVVMQSRNQIVYFILFSFLLDILAMSYYAVSLQIILIFILSFGRAVL